MTSFEETLLKEVSGLPESRQLDVLTYIRYLKLSVPSQKLALERRFDNTVASIRARSRQLGITPEEIEAEIQGVRENDARRS